MSSSRSHALAKSCEICISGLSSLTEPHIVLTYFEQFGKINYYNFTSPKGGGIVFITYEDVQMVDSCMKSRPHRLDSRHIYVKRAMPYDPEYPREHIDSSRDLMIIPDSSFVSNEEFLRDLREYFSNYGTLYACKYCHEESFDYILIECADYGLDQVDRILLDKPHYFHQEKLNLSKATAWNKNLLNEKSFHSIAKTKSSPSDELDLENEVIRLQSVLKNLTEEFSNKRKQLEEECCEELKKLNENSDLTHRLQQDLEKEYTKLLSEYETLKKENESLNEQYLLAELENFEITCYYEQILVEEKAKTAQYESDYTEQLATDSSSPLLPAIPDDD